MTNTAHDKKILTELAKKYMQYANSERNISTIKRWQAHNSLKTADFMVVTGQYPWNEFNADNSLTLQCSDPFLRTIENKLRHDIYEWEHFKTDKTLPSYIEFAKSYTSTGYGIEVEEEQLATDSTNNVVSHAFSDKLSTYEELEKVTMPIITADPQKTKSEYEFLREILGDEIPVRAIGTSAGFRVWDQIAELRSITPILMDFIDRPEFLHDTMRKFTDIYIGVLKQLEAQNLLNPYAVDCHCTGTYCDDLPGEACDENTAKATDCWTYGMAQLFSSCSPAMLKEFELDYAKEYYAHMGLVNYGCCEPLHNCIDDIKKIKNVRKISVSPWADPIVAAEKLGGDIIMARKPNPALLAATFGLSEDEIRKELRTTIDICRSTKTPCDLVLKDLSTVQYEPQRISRWCEIAHEEINR